ncbi:MAG TPA: hypothetical protein VFD33_02225, partial [Bacillota bacterium]|nr:hypothetical protein [Bacillota bacterium]
FSDIQMIVYSLLLVLIMIFRPGGIMGSNEISIAMVGNWREGITTRARSILGRKQNRPDTKEDLDNDFAKDK